MFWTDKVASEIIKSRKNKGKWVVDDMKTPSGRIHVGSLRGVVIHDLIYKALLNQGQKAIYTYCINDMDAMDSVPSYLDQKKFSKYLGWPLCRVPSPEKNARFYSEYYANEFIDAFNKTGVYPKIIWTSKLYEEGKFDRIIKVCLGNTEEIKNIFKRKRHALGEKNYFPYMPICPKCGKNATTKVYQWNGEYVYFRCEKNAVGYTEGCGYEGKIKPERQAGKMPWKIEWAAHWKILGVDIEWAGKDLMSKGSAHEVSAEISEKILNYPTPQADLYEHLLIGGRKMSTSRGLGQSAAEIAEILPPDLLRFLMVRTHYRQTIDFNPQGDTIPDLFDEYDRCAKAFFSKEDELLAAIYKYSQIGEMLKREIFYPRFRKIANLLQGLKVDLEKEFTKEKGKPLDSLERTLLARRVKYVKIWLEKYAKKEIVQRSVKLSDKQKNYLQNVAKLLEQKDWQPEDLQRELYELSKKIGIPAKEAFGAIYLSLTGKQYGPKAGWFLLEQDKQFVIERFKIVQESQKTKKEYLYKIINRPDLFTISDIFKKKYPSVAVGIAIIKGVTIKNRDKNLEEEINNFVESQQGLTTEEIGIYPEIKSYRRIYKETGVDWHSRRPSPEGLLRRIALGKELYNINTCVDAYNLIVMKNRVSVGAFDLDKIKFPTILRFAKKGEKILLLGDKKPTEYKQGEVAYFDQVGGYNIDFNYLDSERTKVTEETKNLWINLEGVHDITRDQVEKSLKETIEIITKYCGGKLELAGIVR